MHRAVSRQRIHADDTFHAAVSVSDSESDYSSHEDSDVTKVPIWDNGDDDEYFFSPMPTSSKEVYEPNTKKRERNHHKSLKTSSPALRKAASSSCLKSEFHHAAPTKHFFTHCIPAKPSEISQPSKMTKHLSYNILPNDSPIVLVKKKPIKKTKKTTKRRTEPVRRSSVTNKELEEVKIFYSGIPDDLKTHILSFLNMTDLRSFMSTSFKNLALCRSEHLWLKFCEEEWTMMKNVMDPIDDERSFFDAHKIIQFQEDFSIPIIPHPTQKSHGGRIPGCGQNSDKQSSNIKHSEVIDWDDLCPNRTNLSVLLQLTQPYPVKVDEYFFSARDKHTSINDTIFPVQQHLIIPEFREFQMSVETKAFPMKRDTTVVQFTSKVGTGDRCIRSDKPFPRIHSSNTRRFPQLNLLGHIAKVRGRGSSHHSSSITHNSPLHDIIKRGKRFWSYSTMKPFVSPIVSKIEEKERNGRKETIYSMNISPRLVSYFEITLISRDESQEPSPLPSSQVQSLSIRNTIDELNQPIASDCVAIGLSNRYFNTSGKMPGWDQYSYGYHGDDGGLFHSGGMMVRSYGPVFGVGDTVGCGIDYVNKGIFFTINGRFLGYGWKEIDLSDPFYPTVGIDTHNPVELNFGSKPFAYDIGLMSKEHHRIIDTALRDLPK